MTTPTTIDFTQAPEDGAWACVVTRAGRVVAEAAWYETRASAWAEAARQLEARAAVVDLQARRVERAAERARALLLIKEGAQSVRLAAELAASVAAVRGRTQHRSSK